MKSNNLYFDEKEGKFIVASDIYTTQYTCRLAVDFKSWKLDLFKAFLGCSHTKEVFKEYSKIDMIKEYSRFEDMFRFMGEIGYVFYAP